MVLAPIPQYRTCCLAQYTTAGNEWIGTDGASLRLQSVPAPFCKRTDGSGNGNVFFYRYYIRVVVAVASCSVSPLTKIALIVMAKNICLYKP